VYPGDEPDPEVFFGDAPMSRKRSWKVQQLCKQVERAAVATLCEWGGDELMDAWVAGVEPAPDAGRLRVIVILGPTCEASAVDAARAALDRKAPAFREEVARAIHRKRVPEIVFDVRLAAEVSRG
jgi:ribosome-binding factor A